MPRHTKLHIYQLLPRLFSNINGNNIEHGTIEQNGVGKFDEINQKALQEIRSMGITHIWYTGIIEHATQTDYSEYGIPQDNPYIVKGRAGSPYAIKDYYDVAPDLATDVRARMDEFEALVQRTHANEMKVLIDFVPNHLARNYYSDVKPDHVEDFGQSDDLTQAFTKDNNFYYLVDEDFQIPGDYNALYVNAETPLYVEKPAKVTGNDVFNAQPSVNDWFETVKLNYGVDYLHHYTNHFDPIPDTWLKMLDVLTFWCNKGVDGFRCDMIEMVPVPFWHWITAKLRRRFPDVVFIGEAYNPNNYGAYIDIGGFDYLYDKDGFYDTVRDIMIGYKSTDFISSIWQAQEHVHDNMLRFMENHDEQRIASRFFAGDAQCGIPAMALATFMGRGPVMLYSGQEVGEPANGAEGFKRDDGRTSIFDYCSIPSLAQWVGDHQFDGANLNQEKSELRNEYLTIFNLSLNHSSIFNGQFYDLHWANRNDQHQNYSDRVYAFIRYDEFETLLITVSFNEKSDESIDVIIPEHAVNQIKLPDTSAILVKSLTDNQVVPVKEINNDLVIKDIIAKQLSYHVLKIQAH